MAYKQREHDTEDFLHVENCLELGFQEGLRAGKAEMNIVKRDFAPHEGNLASGHFLLDSTYVEVKCKISDFPAKRHLDAWLEGFLHGVAQAGARVGFISTVGNPNEQAGATIYLFVHRWPVPADATIN